MLSRLKHWNGYIGAKFCKLLNCLLLLSLDFQGAKLVYYDTSTVGKHHWGFLENDLGLQHRNNCHVKWAKRRRPGMINYGLVSVNLFFSSLTFRCITPGACFSKVPRTFRNFWKWQPMSRKLLCCLVFVFCLSTKMFLELYHQVYPMYWATEGSATFGGFTVETTSHEIFQDFSQREFSVAKKEVGLVVCRNSFWLFPVEESALLGFWSTWKGWEHGNEFVYSVTLISV